MRRSLQDGGEELHRAGCMRQCNKTRMVNGCKQEAYCDANRFIDVVDPVRLGLGGIIFHALEHHDQPWSDFQEGLVLVGTEGIQVIDPGLWCSMGIELVFFRLCSFANLLLDSGILYSHETPGLLVCPAGCCTGSTDHMFDQFSWNGPGGEVTYGAALVHEIMKRRTGSDRALRWLNGLERDEVRGVLHILTGYRPGELVELRGNRYYSD